MSKFREMSGGQMEESLARKTATTRAADPMQAAYDARERLKSAFLIKLEMVIADPNQPRTDFDEEALKELADSLRERGQLQPIRVRWDAQAEKYVVVVGERRWRAARMAGLDTIQAVVMDKDATPDDLLEDQLVENALRRDLKPIEQARAYKRLMDSRGFNQTQLAERLRISQPSVARALSLLNLPEPIQEHVESGDIPPTTAYALTKIPDRQQQEERAREVIAGKTTGETILAKTQSRPSRGTPRSWTHNHLDRVKVSVARLADDVSDDEVLEALKAALAARRKASKDRAA